jgi:hypothetical protein
MSYFTTSGINLYFTYNSAKRTLTLKDINAFIRFWHCVKKPYCILTLSNSWHKRLCFVLYLWEGRNKRYKVTKKIVKFWWRLSRLAGYLNIQGGQFLFPRVHKQIYQHFSAATIFSMCQIICLYRPHGGRKQSIIFLQPQNLRADVCNRRRNKVGM